jgi:ABC-type ATPase with predicted acetyltransferase domain
MGITDVVKLKKDLYKIFVDVQIAWMEFDYDALAKLCGDELYNSYKRDLEILKLKNGKNIMKNFDEISLDIESIYKRDNNIFINVILEVEFYDYVINTKTNKVIRGDKNRLYNNAYLLKYKKENALLDRCPSCGAQIKNLSNQKCPNCKNVIVNNNNDFVLISKGLVE